MHPLFATCFWKAPGDGHLFCRLFVGNPDKKKRLANMNVEFPTLEQIGSRLSPVKRFAAPVLENHHIPSRKIRPFTGS
jgi:hypothetical protein